MLTLEMENVSQKYDDNNWVLREISLTVSPGLFVLLGPNGAGKTTLLRLLGGILAPSAGKVLLDSQDISQDYSQYKQSLGYLPQEFGFYPDMTGKEFLHYMASLKGIPASLYLDRVEEIASCTGVRPLLDRKVRDWSMGLKRRLGIAQALLNDPEILLLDEPMVGLDPEEKLFFWNYFYKLSRDRIVILSSNVLSDFITFADGVLLLVNGGLLFNGCLQELLEPVDGKVWSVTVPAECGQSLAQQWRVSTIHYAGNSCQVRIISDTMPDLAGVQLTDPKVEDAYTYIVSQSNPALKE